MINHFNNLNGNYKILEFSIGVLIHF